ncbi:MAG TPA: hypothetical protein VFK85_10810 [Anaeromyxobacteraceae bacterium]|nr:hypothetical protein [Anaeromyxobacteraceae bacterium]
MTRRRVLLAAAVLATAVACARVDRLLETSPKPSPEDGAWAEQRDRWTRQASLYDGLAMRALATATYQSPEARRTRAERTAAWKAMTPPERAALLADEESELQKYDDFVVSITTADPADNDLNSRTTDWRIAIVRSDAPDVVGPEVVELRADALLRTLYPKIGDFDTAYRVRFARQPGIETWAKPFTLRLAGPRGRLDFPFGQRAPGAEPSADAAGAAPDAAAAATN